MGLGSDFRDDHVDFSTVEDDHGGSGGADESMGSVLCSICLEVVMDNGDRSWAKLQCGHRFHLDCIGSAFNVKGAMQCPNCRKVEKGRWLYANGCGAFPEFNIEDWTRDEDLYDLSYSEMSFGVHWCPFASVTRLPPPFEDGEFSSSSHHDLLGQHRIFAEQPTVPPATHSCPYIAYFGAMHPSSSISSPSVSDTLSVNNQWNGPSVPGETPPSYAFPNMDLHYHSWEPHSSRIGSADQPRSPRNRFGLLGSASFLHPFVGHSSSSRPGSSVASSAVPPYPASNTRTCDRVQALQAYYEQLQPSGSPPATHAPIISRRSNREMAQGGSTASSSDPSSGFFSQVMQASLPNQFHTWERDHNLLPNQIDRDSRWGVYHQAGEGSEPALRYGSLHRRHRC